MPETVWTARRKWMGNVLPTLVSLPFLASGSALALVDGESVIVGGGIVTLGLLAGLVTLNKFGLYDNATMRAELRRKLGNPEGRFVGFARPGYRSLLDPHQDLGFFMVRAEELAFLGEALTVQLPRAAVVRIGKRANPHSWVGLGGWISIEAILEGRPVRMLIEPRDRPTLLGNKRVARTLRAELETWLAGGPGLFRDDRAGSL
ncbi:MAG: hypothetical protein KIS66_12310 [Fimbriimonadaceae bacterium]|nr:hypothetical protein [Fimbriimonadaceae bacterium]